MSGADTLEGLRLRVAALEAEVARLTAPLPTDAQDDPWQCLKCHHVIALDDKQANIIRVRMGSMMVMMSPGPGTWMQIICPRCGYLNHSDGPPMPEDLMHRMEAAATSPGPAQ